MDEQIHFTHKGWFGICPVYFADTYSDAPVVDPRHWSLAPLFWLSEWLFTLAFIVIEMADPDAEPQWPLRITGEINGR